MKTRSLAVALCFCIIALLFSVPSYAGEVHAESKVVAVTAYPGLAAITRSGTAKLTAGPQTIIVDNMPAGFNESSLRVQGAAKAAVKIGSVEVKHVFLAELAAAAEQEKAKALQAKRDELSMIDAEIRALQIKSNFIENLADKGSGDSTQDSTVVIKTEKGGELSPDKWSQAWGMIQTGMAETQKDIVTKQIARRNLSEEIAKLQKEYNQVKTAQREKREVIIHVEAAQDTDFDFTVTYQTGGVSWYPLYDARLDTDKAELKLEQYGQISQQTGEDWNDVALTFSTSRPELGTEMPRLWEWYINAEKPVYEYSKGLAMEDATSVGSGYAIPGAVGSPHNKKDPLGEFRAETEKLNQLLTSQRRAIALPVAAQVAGTDFAAEFRVPGRVDLKSVAEPSKFFVGDQTMKAELLVQTTPRLGSQAYLFAKVKNDAKYPIIQGSVAKYRDGAFMGNATIEQLRPGESTDLSFGVDDRIKVSFQQTESKQEKPALVLIGDVTTERAYKTKIKNLHKTPMKITVFDHYPVSRSSDVKVSLQEDRTTKGFVKDKENRQGVIMWEATYQPQEEKAFDLAFEVKHSKDATIPNL